MLRKLWFFFCCFDMKHLKTWRSRNKMQNYNNNSECNKKVENESEQSSSKTFMGSQRDAPVVSDLFTFVVIFMTVLDNNK